MVDVGGFRLHLKCSGEGSPTIVLDAGLGDSNLVWAEIQSILAQTNRVCSYDRAGVGWSDRGPRPRTFQKAAEELHTLLIMAGEIGPYVLVGHSAGVNSIRLFAHSYPEDVAGMVLIEPPILDRASPILLAIFRTLRRVVGLLSKWGVIRYLGKASRMSYLFAGASPPQAVADQAGFLYRSEVIQASIDEIDGLPETIRLLKESQYPGAWRDWPVVVISAYKDRMPEDSKLAPLNSLAALSSSGKVVQVKSSHFVHFDQPELVVKCIQEVVGESHNQA
jgi:pimeloyl-ACP methyl ester carboxylesterase